MNTTSEEKVTDLDLFTLGIEGACRESGALTLSESPASCDELEEGGVTKTAKVKKLIQNESRQKESGK